MWGDGDPPWARDTVEPAMHLTERAQGQRQLRVTLVAVLALVVAMVGVVALLSFARTPAKSSSALAHTASPRASVSPRDATWHDVGLSADEQIVFSHSAAQTAYTCGIVNKTVVMHVTHDGGMNWQLLAPPKPIASELCTLAVDDTNPQQLALMARTTKPDPCLANPCTPTPCANTCQPCVDYCGSPQQTFTLYRSANGGSTWMKTAPLPNGNQFTFDMAFAGSTLYVWTGTWPTLLAASVAGGPFQLINLSAYYPPPQQNNGQSYQGSLHLWPLIGQLYLPLPTPDANMYIVTADGGISWTRRTFTMDGDPVALRQASGLDGRTLMGERIHTIGHLVLSLDGGSTWQPAPAPYPDFTHGQMQCYVSADGRFLWFNGYDAIRRLGVYWAKPGATAWTKILDESQIQDISLDLVSYDASGHMVALWGRESRTKWVVYRLP